MKKAKFDISKYYSKEDAVYHNDDFKKSFYKFLKKGLNTHPFDFIEEVLSLKDIDDEKEKIKNINRIINKFINDKSEKELNLSGEMKNDFFESYKNQKGDDKWVLNVNINDIFDDIFKIVKKELFFDKFTSFVRTEECINLIKKHYKNENLVVSRKKKDYEYTNLDFITQVITYKDMEMIDETSKDSFDWKKTEYLKKDEYIGIGYYSPNVEDFFFSIIKKHSCALKNEILCPLTFKQICDVMFDVKEILVKFILTFRDINTTKTSIILTVMKQRKFIPNYQTK